MSEASVALLRVRPRIWIGFAISLGYTLVVFVVGSLPGVPYTDLGRDGGTMLAQVAKCEPHTPGALVVMLVRAPIARQQDSPACGREGVDG